MSGTSTTAPADTPGVVRWLDVDRRLWRLIAAWTLIAWTMAVVATIEAARLHWWLACVCCAAILAGSSFGFWHAMLVLRDVRRAQQSWPAQEGAQH